MGLFRWLATWVADDDLGMLAAVAAPAPKLAVSAVVRTGGGAVADTIGVYDVDDFPNIAAALAEADARAHRWSPRRDGLCLACNGGQHQACEGVEAPGGPCLCYDQAHVLVAAPGRPVPAVLEVAGTHRSCLEAAARVCACCAPLIAATVGAGGRGEPATEDAPAVAVIDMGCMQCGEDSDGDLFCVRCDARAEAQAKRLEDR